MEYLYDDGEYYYFMNTENYEQMHLTKELLGDADGLPDSAVEGGGGVLRRQADQRGTAGDRGFDCGRNRAGPEGRDGFQRHQAGQDGDRLVVQVPPFITEGEKIRVNTAEGTYQERA